MRFWDEVDEAIKKVRQGQEATCPLCKKGKLVPVGNPKTQRTRREIWVLFLCKEIRLVS